VPRAIKAQVDLGWDESENTPAWAAIEPSLLREAIANVLDNAIRYAGEGAEVTVGLQTLPSEIVIWIRDNGPGIDPALQPHVFERFVRGTETGSGCGLGLAIVRDIVLRHGGHIALRHPKPRGLEIRMTLPQAQQPQAFE
jgi:two-component system sensor histidine kinase TctE